MWREEELRRKVAPPRATDEVIEAGQSAGRTVALVTAGAPPDRPGCERLSRDPTRPIAGAEVFTNFASRGRGSAFVLELDPSLVAGHSRAPLIARARETRKRTEAFGPIAIGLAAGCFSDLEALLREILSLPGVAFPGIVSAGSERRALVRTFATGPRSREELRGALTDRADDLLELYLDALLRHGIVRTEGSDRLLLTAHGEQIARALEEIERSPARPADGSCLYPLPPRAPPPAGPRSGS